jgi:hypothetical protein
MLDRLPKVLTETDMDWLFGFMPLCGRIFKRSGLWVPIPALLFGCGCLSAPSSRLGLGTHRLGLFGNYFWQKV